MEGWPIDKLCSVLGAVAAIWAVIYAAATYKVQLNNLPETSQNKRSRILAPLLFVGFAVSLIGAGLATRPPIQATTDAQISEQRTGPSPEVPKTEVRPMPEVPKTDVKPAPAPVWKPSPEPTPAVTRKDSDSVNAVDTLIKGIKLYSNNALMGDFPINLKQGDEKIVVAVINPTFRVGSDNEYPGIARTVTHVQAFVGDHDELMKISRGKPGIADSSEPYDLTELKVVLNGGQPKTVPKTIELSVPKKVSANLSGKSILIKMSNKLSGSSKFFPPAWAVSERNVFGDQ